MKLKEAKTGSSWSVKTNTKLDMYVTALLSHGVVMMMVMTMIGVAFPVCVVNVL